MFGRAVAAPTLATKTPDATASPIAIPEQTERSLDFMVLLVSYRAEAPARHFAIMTFLMTGGFSGWLIC